MHVRAPLGQKARGCAGDLSGSRPAEQPIKPPRTIVTTASRDRTRLRQPWTRSSTPHRPKRGVAAHVDLTRAAASAAGCDRLLEGVPTLRHRSGLPDCPRDGALLPDHFRCVLDLATVLDDFGGRWHRLNLLPRAKATHAARRAMPPPASTAVASPVNSPPRPQGHDPLSLCHGRSRHRYSRRSD